MTLVFFGVATRLFWVRKIGTTKPNQPIPVIFHPNLWARGLYDYSAEQYAARNSQKVRKNAFPINSKTSGNFPKAKNFVADI